MTKATLALLKALTEASGVPGFEGRVAAVVERQLGSFCQVARDNLGSIICRHGKSGPKVMLAGHMDEIGFMVRQITKGGFLKFHPLGGWLPQVVLSQRMIVEGQKGPVLGVVASKPPHLVPADKRDAMVSVDEMFIDIGAKDKEEATDTFGIRPGDPIVPVSQFTPLANPKFLMAKAWDDRVGVALVVDALLALKGKTHPNVVYGVGTTQEEVGLRGAQTSVQAVGPDVALVLETAIPSDVPGVGDDDPEVKLGGGAVVYVFEGSAIPNVRLRDLAIGTCEQEKIPCQLGFLPSGGTDAGRIHVHAHGVPSLVIGCATRHIHAPDGILHADDYDAALKLVVALLRRLDTKTVASLAP